MKKTALFVSVLLIFALLTACTSNASVGIIGGADGPTAVITGNSTSVIAPEDVLAMAMGHAGVTADSVHAHTPELEKEDGQLIYEVEFHDANTSYSYEIHAQTGEILSFEKD